MPLDNIELQILNSLTFPESFGVLMEEVAAPEKIIGDCLKGLMDKDLVHSLSKVEGTEILEKGFFYNSDNMHDYSYQITAKGLDELF